MQFLANRWQEAVVIAVIAVIFLMPNDALRRWRLKRSSDSSEVGRLNASPD
jgi:hypothetical protein